MDPTRYRAPSWLRGGHAQTIVPATLIRLAAPPYRRERVATPDHDFVDFDWLDTTDLHAPVLVVFHGLEGSSRSHYARALMVAAQTRGWRGVVAHFRGCSGELNRAPRFYHSGDSAEIRWMIDQVRVRFPAAPLYAVGVSLGGNALLRWLGEQPDESVQRLTAAAAISAPLDLAAGGHALGRGFNKVYTRSFLRTLQAKSLLKLDQFPGLFDRDAMLGARDLYAFDNVVTAPLHGYRDTDDYWQRAASKPVLLRVRLATLVLNARNDPFLPAAALPGPDQVSSAIRLDYPGEGGHVGFYGRDRGLDWLPERVFHFLLRGQ